MYKTKQLISNFQAELAKSVKQLEAELKNGVAYKKKRVPQNTDATQTKASDLMKMFRQILRKIVNRQTDKGQFIGPILRRSNNMFV